MSALSVCMPALQKTASNHIIDICDLLCGYWELKPEPLEEQPLHLPVEPSLQPWRLYHSMASLWFFSAFSQAWCEICFSTVLSLPGNENLCDHKQNESRILLRCSDSHKKAGTRGRYLFSMSSSCPIGCRKKTRELNGVLLIFLEYQHHSWRLPFTTQSPESPSLCSTTLRVNISIYKSWGEAFIQAITHPL